MRTATTYENARINHASPAEEELDKLEDLLQQRRRAISLANTRRMQLRTFSDDVTLQLADRALLLSSQLAQYEARRAEVTKEIYAAMRADSAMLSACKAAYEALCQAKNYPADIEAAKKWLGDAIKKVTT